MQPHRYWHKGVPADLKIVMFLLVMTLMMAIVYLAVDQIFSLISNDKVYQAGQKIKDERFRDSFTKQPVEEPSQPAVYKTEEQKEAEKNARDPGTFGYVHPLIIGLFFSIIAITLLGFLLYAVIDKLGNQKE